MGKRRSSYKKSTKCPEPLNTLVDLAGAATLGAIVRAQIKRDYRNGQGDESVKAAAMVFGAGSLRRGSEGIINLGGLMGLNSALRSIKRDQSIKRNQTVAKKPPDQDAHSSAETRNNPFTRKNVWRDYCEDGSAYGIDPKSFDSPDDYCEALAKAKDELLAEEFSSEKDGNSVAKGDNETPINMSRGMWRKSCSDGTPYGLKPEDFNSADDYEEAIEEAKQRNSAEEL